MKGGKVYGVAHKGFTPDELSVLNRMNVQYDETGKFWSIPYGKAEDTGLTEVQFVMCSLGVSRYRANKLIGYYLELLDKGIIGR